MDKSDHMINVPDQQTDREVEEEFFFYLLEFIVVNSCIILHPCGSKLSRRDFRLRLIRKLIQEIVNTRIIPYGMPAGWKANTFCICLRKEQGGVVLYLAKKKTTSTWKLPILLRSDIFHTNKILLRISGVRDIEFREGLKG
jgi:hypothetical protein